MGRLEVVYRPAALADLIGIYKSICERGGSPVIAAGFVARIKSRCDLIGEAPLAGRLRHDLEPDLRTIGFERRVVVAYKIEDSRVRIGNVFYGGRNYEAIYGQSAAGAAEDEA